MNLLGSLFMAKNFSSIEFIILESISYNFSLTNLFQPLIILTLNKALLNFFFHEGILLLAKGLDLVDFDIDLNFDTESPPYWSLFKT